MSVVNIVQELLIINAAIAGLDTSIKELFQTHVLILAKLTITKMLLIGFVIFAMPLARLVILSWVPLLIAQAVQELDI